MRWGSRAVLKTNPRSRECESDRSNCTHEHTHVMLLDENNQTFLVLIVGVMMTSTKQQSKNEEHQVTALHSASLTGDNIPTQVLIAPWGQVESTNGSFVVDEESVRFAIDAFNEHATDLPIDYEHQTLGGTYASPDGRAPAAGWIKRLESKPGVGLVAHIEWTQQATTMLTAKEYRYLSPVAMIRKSDRKLVAIHSAALTNKPAIKGMQPIVNKAQLEMSVDEGVNPLAQLRADLKLEVDADAQEVLVAASKRLMDLERQTQQRHIDQRISEALRAGKLVEAQRTWAETLVAKEEGLFDEWFRTAPVVVVVGITPAPEGVEASHHHRLKVTTRARSEFRSHSLLNSLTSEEAFISDALRESDRMLN